VEGLRRAEVAGVEKGGESVGISVELSREVEGWELYI
jgi:hypothetical protein